MTTVTPGGTIQQVLNARIKMTLSVFNMIDVFKNVLGTFLEFVTVISCQQTSFSCKYHFREGNAADSIKMYSNGQGPYLAPTI